MSIVEMPGAADVGNLLERQFGGEEIPSHVMEGAVTDMVQEVNDPARVSRFMQSAVESYEREHEAPAFLHRSRIVYGGNGGKNV